MDLRTRHTAGPNEARLKQAQREVEKAVMELDAMIFPENYGQHQSEIKDIAPARIEKLSEIIRFHVREIETLIPSERDPSKRDLLKKRLEATIQRFQDLDVQVRSKGTSWAHRARFARDREHLLGKKNDFDAEAAEEITTAVAEGESLKKSSNSVDEIMNIGRAVLESLGSQRETLRRATDKVESVAGSIGISNSLLRAVRRRQFGDAMIVYGGMVAVVIILYLFYRWVHS